MTHVNADGMATVLNRGEYSSVSLAAQWATELDQPVSPTEKARAEFRRGLTLFTRAASSADLDDDATVAELALGLEGLARDARAILPSDGTLTLEERLARATRSAENAHAALEQIQKVMLDGLSDGYLAIADVHEVLRAAGYAADSQALGKEAADRNRELGT